MAATLQKKSGGGTKGNGGVSGAIVPPRKQVDNFPLMTFLSKNCSFDDDGADFLENEEALKVANDKRVDEMLSKATSSVKAQNKDGSSSEESARRSALELLRSMEQERNMKDTWKVSESNPKKKDYKDFLYPLRHEKEDDYFSGIPKVKQARERKRCRSDEVVLLENGKLVPKNSADYYDNNEVAQLPLKFNLPVRRPPRVPSVGLPFTPGPPIPTENNRWMQKSGTELFSNVQSRTLFVSGNEGDDLALAIAESIRTAKEEEQRHVRLQTLYQSQIDAQKSANLFPRDPAAPAQASWGSASWEVKPTPPERNRSMSVDSTSTNQIWDEEMTSLISKQDYVHDPNNNNNNNFEKTESASKLNGECLNQRPRHSEEQKISKSPPPPMLAGLEKSVSHKGTVITLQAPDTKKFSPPMKQSDDDDKEEVRPQNMTNEKEMSENEVLASWGDRKSEPKQEKEIPKTSHVPETFDCPKITSSRLPTSNPSAFMSPKKNSTPSTNDIKASHDHAGHNARTAATSPEVLISEEKSNLMQTATDKKSSHDHAEHSARTTASSPEVLIPEEKSNLKQTATDKKSSHNYVGHKARTNASSPEVPPLLIPPKELVLEEEKPKTQRSIAAGNPNLTSAKSHSTVPEISSNAALSQPHPQQPATLSSSSISLEEFSRAQAQFHQMLLMQQAMATPQVLQNGQNFEGVNGQFPNQEKQYEMGQAYGTASLTNTTSSLPQTVPGLSGIMPPFPNHFLGGIPGYPFPGILPAQTYPFPGPINPLPGVMPGLANLLPGAAPGLADCLPGAVPGGLPDPSIFPGVPSFAQHAGLPAYPGIPVSSHSNIAPSGLPGFQNAMAPEFQTNPLSNMQGLQSNLPGGVQIPVSTPLIGIQNCNSFGGMAQSYTTPQPGCAPLMGGRGRGRLAPTTLK